MPSPDAAVARDPSPSEGKSRRAPIRWGRLAAGLLILLAVIVLVRTGSDRIPDALRAIDALGPWAAVAFIALYAGAAVAWIPGSILTLAAGAIFGLIEGTLYTIVGATLGASLAFLVSRYVARSAIERRLGDSPKLRAVDEAVAREGAKVVFLIRLSPIFPYNALNYALGLTRVKFREYVPASALGMIPGTFMYVYAGHTAGQVAAGTAGAGPEGLGRYALLVLGLLATVAVTVLVTRTARRALARTADLETET
ncbi:MAG: TVP38/TMEM64 family protein [Gemmatimonadota bacterium]